MIIIRLAVVSTALLASVNASSHHERSSTADCVPAPNRLQGPRVMSADGLAGGYSLTIVSNGPNKAGRRTSGTLWLWPALGTDSSPRTGRRAVAGDSVHSPLYGATNVDFLKLTSEKPDDEATLHSRTDPIYPEVLVTKIQGVSKGTPWQEVTLWIGSFVNRRDGEDALDGGGYDMHVTQRDSLGFRGRWGPAGIVATDSGYFCAVRIRR